MRHHDDALPQLINGGAKKLQDLARGSGVQVAGRFVGDDHCWLRCERTGNGDALLLATRHFLRAMLQAIPDAEHVDDHGEPTAVRLLSGQVKGKLNVCARIKSGNKVEALEYETDAVATKTGQRVIIQLRQGFTFDPNLATGRQIETGKHVKHGRLT